MLRAGPTTSSSTSAQPKGSVLHIPGAILAMTESLGRNDLSPKSTKSSSRSSLHISWRNVVWMWNTCATGASATNTRTFAASVLLRESPANAWMVPSEWPTYLHRASVPWYC